MEYHSEAKTIWIMKLSGEWMKLKVIILSEVTQTEKDKRYHLFPLIRAARSESLYRCAQTRAPAEGRNVIGSRWRCVQVRDERM